MKNKVIVRDLVIGEGRTKLCLPVVGKTQEEILEQAARIRKSKHADLAEWRADWYGDIFDADGKVDEEAVLRILKELREALGKLPLLFTFRSRREGGERNISELYYESLLMLAASSRYVDLVDVEMTVGDRLASRLIRHIHSHKAAVILSSHDFEKTPPKEEMLFRLQCMQRLGADICKLAVTPKDKQDVMNLLEVTYRMHEEYAQCPLITMSMGKLGSISRMTGEFFGSAVTFGCLGASSAPGQIEALKLAAVLQVLHENL